MALAIPETRDGQSFRSVLPTLMLLTKLRDESPASLQRSGMGCLKRVETHALHAGKTDTIGEVGTGGVLSFQGHDTVALDAQELIDQAEHPVNGVEGEPAAGSHDMEIVPLDGGLQVKLSDEVGSGADILVHLVITEDLAVDEPDDRVQLGAEILQVGDLGAMQRCRDTHDRAAAGQGLGGMDEHTAALAVAMQHHLCSFRNLGVDEVGQLVGCGAQTTAGIGEPHTVDGAVTITMNRLGRQVQGICLKQNTVGIDPDGVSVAIKDDRCAILTLIEKDEIQILGVVQDAKFFVVVGLKQMHNQIHSFVLNL